MSIYNLGSINLDHLYRVDHFVRPGETLASTDYRTALGGKGANQSIALARAGAKVKHLGAINRADAWVLEQMQEAGVDTGGVDQLESASGHAIIQLTGQAENAIILYPGANHEITPDQIEQGLAKADKRDWLLMQNETNGLAEAIAQAHRQGVRVAFNPAPMVVETVQPLLAKLDLLVVNEVEAMDLSGTDSIAEAENKLQADYPDLRILLTLGREGVTFISPDGRVKTPAFKVDAVDTTAAGDTFIGYCLAALAEGAEPQMAMRRGAAAAALCVMRMGAAVSIPNRTEVDDFLQSQQD